MTEAELRDIIRLILDAIAEVHRPKRGLVVFTGAAVGFDEALASLRQAKTALPLAFVQTNSAKFVLDQEKVASLGLEPAGPHLTVGYDLLIVPTLTANTAAKAAYSMADALASNLIMEYLLMGKPVVAASTAADPDAPAKRALFPHPAPGQAAVMRDNLRRLADLGVQLCAAEALGQAICQAAGLPAGPPASLPPPVRPPAAPPAADSTAEPIRCPERLLAAHQIQGLPDGATVIVRPDAIITHMAIDMARQRSIIIERA